MEDDDIDEGTTMSPQPYSVASTSDAITLEGNLLVRKGRSSGHSTFLYKKRSVYLHFEDGGSIDVYRESKESAAGGTSRTRLRTAFSKLQKTLSQANVTKSKEASGELYISVPSYLPWIVKDVENDPHAFVVEIPTEEAHHVMHLEDEDTDSQDGVAHHHQHHPKHAAAGQNGFDNDNEYYSDDDNVSRDSSAHFPLASIPEDLAQEVLYDELQNAKKKGRPLRFYFKCIKGSNEKALWIRAFSRLDRLSDQPRTKPGILGALSSPLHFKWNRERTRSASDANIILDTQHLDICEQVDEESVEAMGPNVATDVTQLLVRGGQTTNGRDKEYRVLPTYAYPHRWMTHGELRNEMNSTSATFHDLRIPNCPHKEIGQLSVEVLECLGLPKLDRTSDTDAIVYLVCGSYAFSTDVIPNRSSPMWLRKTKRACIIPLFHAYARLFVGVFDHDTKKTKDDFAGRVALDLNRLRPGSVYDVTLPLRLSTHVYSRRRRGAVRLRLSLQWHKERDALFSYIPQKVRLMLPQHSKPDFSTTVACADAKSFRNIAITVHGAHMPNRFTFQQMKAAIREINFTRKYIFTALRLELRDTRTWVNPSVSAFVFLSWMHCIYANSFALVPAYLVLYLLLQLLRLYAKYATDGPVQCGFVPPSWEELFMALLNGWTQENRSIEPMEMGLRPLSLERRRTPQSADGSIHEISDLEYKVKCHRPAGKPIFHLLGFVPRNETAIADQSHLEFPFADADIKNYPKFKVKDSLVHRKGEKEDDRGVPKSDSAESDDAVQISTDKNGEMRIIPKWHIEMPEIPHLMRKDSSGLNDKDEEDLQFTTRKAIRHGGYALTKRAGKTITTATELAGLNYVVSPVRRGIGAGMHTARDVVATTPMPFRRSTSKDFEEMELAENESNETEIAGDNGKSALGNDGGVRPENLPGAIVENGADGPDEVDMWPEQNIDIEGPSTGKKITDDLADIKDKMHELTWHLFDDHIYCIRDEEDICYFGEAKKSDRKKKKELSSRLDKLLEVGQYSHPNPFISRVGMYVEPMVASTYSFLCFFRAGYNIFIWRDPMLTFWVTVILGILAFVLFIFPWRIFMFLVGFGLLGPQNWVIRILREKGKLPPAKKFSRPKDEKIVFDPTSQPIFSSNNKDNSNTPDHREVHQIVVPYSPLLYQRFYDWPPEPQYAQVIKEAQHENNRRQRRNGTRFARHKRRGHRKGASQNGLDNGLRLPPFPMNRHRRLPSDADALSGLLPPPPPPRRRSNTGDWNPAPAESRPKLD